VNSEILDLRSEIVGFTQENMRMLKLMDKIDWDVMTRAEKMAV